MVIWRNIIKGTLKASLPTIIFPAIFVAWIVKHFGFTIDSLLVVVLLGQFYIICGQLEVALRQTHLSTLEYKPEFKIEIEKGRPAVGVSTGQSKVTVRLYHVKLRNVGKHLARNIFSSKRIEEYQPESKILGDLAPSEAIEIFNLEAEKFNNSKITVELDYNNILGEFGRITFVKKPEFPKFMAVKATREMPGILLNSLEELILNFKAITFSRKIKNTQKNKNKE